MKLPWSKKKPEDNEEELRSQVLRQIVDSRNSKQAVPEYTLADFINIGNRDVGIAAKAKPPEPPAEEVSPDAALRAFVTGQPIVTPAEALDEEALRQLSLEELVGLLESDEPPPPMDHRFSA